MKKLLFATTNTGKLRNAVNVFEHDGIEILKLSDFQNIRGVEETGATFQENAILKAKGYFEQIGIPCFADDGGLVIDALGGAPGVYSKRWLGRDATDAELAEAVIERMKGIPSEERTAKMGSCIAFWNGKNLLSKENWLHGSIAGSVDTSRIIPGLPFRPLFVVPQFGKLYSDLTEEEHNQVYFRWKNLKELRPEILKFLV